MRRLLTNYPIELEARDGGYETFLVTLWTDQASVLTPRGKFLKRGSKAFQAALRRLREYAQDGSLLSENMAQCADTADL